MKELRALGATGLHCHPLGFGCYRIAAGHAGHEAALRAYLARGGNLIDTSANYGDGASEELVGKVLHGVPRSRVIVVTKGGYIQGENMALAQQRRFPEVVEYGPGIWHSIHPEFLETQIERSCRRMQRDYVDVYLLHNPEYFLEEISHRRSLTAADHDEFYRRIREAFRFLEQKVSEGVIGWYGISSNNFGKPAFPQGGSPTAMTSVARCWNEAAAVSASHHFRAVQLPLNLYEPGGALEKNNEGQTVLEFCQSRGIGVLANRPLNAFHGNQMIRLADWAAPGSPPPGPGRLRELIEPVRSAEEKFASAMGEPIHLASGSTPSELFLRVVPQLQSAAQWREVAGYHVIEPLQAWLAQARGRFAQDPAFQQWLEEFAPGINSLLAEVERYLAAKQQGVSDQIRQRLRQAGYPDADDSLSQMALRVLAGLDGLSCVLVGMRRAEYVEDAMGIADRELIDSLPILSRFSLRSS